MTSDSYSELGSKLSQARERRNVNLRDASRELHIRARYLEALETGNLDNLPGDTFVKGYLHRYANYLGLDGHVIVEEYEALGALPQHRLFYIPEAISKEQHPSRRLVIASGVLALIVALAWVQRHPETLIQRAFVQPPPVSPAVGRYTLAPQCMERKKGVAAWPPCYYYRINVWMGQIPGYREALISLRSNRQK